MPNTRQAHVLAGILSALFLAATAPAASAFASHDEMLRQLIHDAALGRIPYQMLTPGLAEAVRPQAATAQAELSALGALKSVTLQATDKAGVEIYRTVFERGVLEWAFHVDDKGLIDNAIYRPAKAGPP